MTHQRNITIRIVTALALYALALVIILSLALVIVHADHHCHGAQCAACLHIGQATATLRTLAAAAFLLLGVLCSARPYIVTATCGSVLGAAERTPVALRTRMDN